MTSEPQPRPKSPEDIIRDLQRSVRPSSPLDCLGNRPDKTPGDTTDPTQPRKD